MEAGRAGVFGFDRVCRCDGWYGTLETDWFKPYATREGELWLVTDKSEKPLGHFVVGNEEAQAIIPE